jgi:hypothetical protein
MVTKSTARQKKGRVKVGKLKLNKETVKNLTGSQKKRIKGGGLTVDPAICTTVGVRVR